MPKPMFSPSPISASTSTMNSEAVKVAVKRSFSEVTEVNNIKVSSNYATRGVPGTPYSSVMWSPPSKFVAVRTCNNLASGSAPSTQFGGVSAGKRVWAAVPTVRRESLVLTDQTPAPASALRIPASTSFSCTPRIMTPTPSNPTSTTRARTNPPLPFVSAFKVVPTQSPQPKHISHPPKETTPPLSFNKSSCERCNCTFIVEPTTTSTPVDDGYLCTACVVASSPAPNMDVRDMKGLPHPPGFQSDLGEDEIFIKKQTIEKPVFAEIVTDSMDMHDEEILIPDSGDKNFNYRASSLNNLHHTEADLNGGVIATTPVTHDSDSGSDSDSWLSPVGEAYKVLEGSLKAAVSPALIKTNDRASSKRVKLYTVGSTTVNGNYDLKSAENSPETQEKLRQRNARIYKADYRAHERELLTAPPPSSSPQDNMLYISPLERGTVTALESLPKGPPSRIRKRRKVIAATMPQECKAHSDLDCTDECCVSDFFEEYDPYSQFNEEVRSTARRNQPGINLVRSIPKVRTALDNEEQRKEKMAISLVTRKQGQRRPYMTLRARSFVRTLGDWSGFSGYDALLIHVDYTLAEADAVRWHVARGQPQPHDLKIDQQIGFHASTFEYWHGDLNSVLGYLPGRTDTDVIGFVEDCKTAYLDHKSYFGETFITITPSCKRSSYYPLAPSRSSLRLLREMGKGFTKWGEPRESVRAMQMRVRDTLPAWKVFGQGSSDILDISWSPDGQRFGLSCCTFDDQYNRPGNLMLGSLDSLRIRMLDGHKVLRLGVTPQTVLDRYLYSTVTSVKFSRDGQLMFSGSYDETVKIWLGDDGTHLNSVDLHSAVSHLATSPVHQQLIAAGCKNGNVNILRIDANGNLETNPIMFNTTKLNLEAATLAWCNSLRPNWLIAGYDNSLEKGNSGDLLIFDVVAEKVALKVMPGSTRQFDVFLDETGSTFATAAIAGSSRSGKNIKTQIRLYNLNSNTGRNTRSISEFDSEQCDINKVTISPCQTYVTASGTDGSTIAWDRRNPNHALHVLRHRESLMVARDGGDPELDDTGVTCALWGPTNDRLYTGGSDGVVKIWDIKRGEPFIQDFATLDSQIMSGAFSPQYDMLMVGECSGKATLFSAQGDKGVPPSLFDIDISDVGGGVHEGQTETGADIARALVESGKIVVKDRYVWATGL